MKSALALIAIPFLLAAVSHAGGTLPQDVVGTSGGDLSITFVGHGTLIFTYGGKVIHVDPYSKLADYGTLPDADLVLITHDHGDHLDLQALEAIRKAETVVVANPKAAEKLHGAVVLRNGEAKTVLGIPVEAVPAYNLVHMRSEGVPFHPRGVGNGYVLTFGDKRLYVAGDTENIPEMKSMGKIEVAFLPANLPYTMTPEMVADAARMIRPAILYPYHTGETDVARIASLLSDTQGVEVRIRAMK